MAKCKACGLDFASTNQTDEICYVCERALKRLNGYAVPVVRCRDCIFKCREVSGELYVICERNDYTEFPMDGYCCYGKRREENG